MYAILTSKPGQFRSEAGAGLTELETYDYLLCGRLQARFVIAQFEGRARVRIIDDADPASVNSVPAKFLPAFKAIEEARAELEHLTRFGTLDATLVRRDVAPPPAAPAAAAERVHITFINGNERQVSAPANSNLLRVSLREQGGIPFKCGGGICGTCKCRIESGIEHTDAVKPKERKHLNDEQLAQGYRMACQTFVNGDIRVSW
jgi:ferredoxin